MAGDGFFDGGSRPASQSRIPVEREVRIRGSEGGQPACRVATFTYPAGNSTAFLPMRLFTMSLFYRSFSAHLSLFIKK
jgi:hypothetical protein